MLFNSGAFGLFFAAFLGLYWLTRDSSRWRDRLVVAASWFFYGWWDWRFLGLLVASSLIDWRLGIAVEDAPAPARRRWIVLSVAVNLGVLGIFKYLGFFADSFAALLRALGLRADMPSLHLVLPVGISFYTFQSLGYVLDVHRGRARACRDPVRFLAFVAFFPQLVAGPIERASHLLAQFDTPRRITAEGLREGVWLVLLGLFRKVVVADNLGALADIAFGQERHTAAGVAAGAAAFALQIYGDFAGYSDMARGLARMLGFELMENFRLPYFATDLRDFWRRWHVSLSEWLRDNVYVPLGGNRHGVARTAANLLLTMLLGGLWHGAAWHFVAWGAWHGAGLAALRLVGSAGGAAGRPRSGGLVAGIGRAATLLFVLGGWVLFRATDLGVAGRMLAALATPTAPEWFREAAVNLAWFGLPMLALDLAQRRAGCPEWGARLGFVGRTLVQGPMLFAVAAYWRREGSPFIYFQF